MIPSVSIPYGQRFLHVFLANADEIARGDTTPDFTPPIIDTFELVTNNVFVNPEIHDIFIKRIGFSLIRVHRIQKIAVNSGSNQFRLDQLKFPVETIYLGIRPDANLNTMEDWWRYTFIENISVPFAVAIPSPAPPPNFLLSVSTGIYKRPIPTIDTIQFETHGIIIYKTTPASFFNGYIPYNYGSEKIGTTDDAGALMVTFNLYPGTYQPSGHINLSRSREFYIRYTSSTINSILTGVLVVIAICINFLLISDGSAALRYNT